MRQLAFFLGFFCFFGFLCVRLRHKERLENNHNINHDVEIFRITVILKYLIQIC